MRSIKLLVLGSVLFGCTHHAPTTELEHMWHQEVRVETRSERYSRDGIVTVRDMHVVLVSPDGALIPDGDIKRVYQRRRSRGALEGLGIGGLVGAGLGVGLGAGAGISDAPVVLGAAGVVLGGLVGLLIGTQTGKDVYLDR